MPIRDLQGQTFNRLHVRSLAYTRNKCAWWNCQCMCGTWCKVKSWSITSGHTKSCGCLNMESLKLRPNRLSHGQSRKGQMTKEYGTWSRLINRCYNVRNSRYAEYGGRGITVCKRWRGKNGFINFFQDMGQAPATQHSIDRKDNSKGYTPGNCQWSTSIIQCRNKRSNINITWKGKTQCIKAWSEELRIPYLTLYSRLRIRNWPVRKSFTEPIGKWR